MESIDDLDAWLTTVVGRLALDTLRKARARRAIASRAPLCGARRVGRAWIALGRTAADPATPIESVS